MSGSDLELVSNPACNAVHTVRQELAISLPKAGAATLRVSDAEQVEAAVAILRADPSHRVRHQVSLVIALPSADSTSGDQMARQSRHCLEHRL